MHELDITNIEALYSLAPFVVPLITGALQIGKGIAQNVKANKQKREAQDAIANYKRQDLTNVYEGNDYYNEEARKLAKQQINQNLATVAAAASQGGARSLGVAAQAQGNANQATLGQAAQEQQAYIDHQNLVSQDNQRIQGMQEDRENQDIAGLSNLYNTANQNAQQGTDQAFQALGSIGAYGYDALQNQETPGSGDPGRITLPEPQSKPINQI